MYGAHSQQNHRVSNTRCWATSISATFVRFVHKIVCCITRVYILTCICSFFFLSFCPFYFCLYIQYTFNRLTDKKPCSTFRWKRIYIVRRKKNENISFSSIPMHGYLFYWYISLHFFLSLLFCSVYACSCCRRNAFGWLLTIVSVIHVSFLYKFIFGSSSFRFDGLCHIQRNSILFDDSLLQLSNSIHVYVFARIFHIRESIYFYFWAKERRRNL